MSVRKRKWTTAAGETKEAWIVDYHDQGGGRHIETFARKKDADARHAEVRVDVKAGIHVAPSRSPTVLEAGENWIKGAEARGLERSTLKQYREHLRNHIAPTIGGLKLSDLAIAHVRGFEDKLRASGRSPKMTSMILTSLGALIGDAQERGLAARNPVRDMRRSRKKRADREQRSLRVGVDIPSAPEVSAIIAAATPRWRPFFVLAAFTGLRASELRGLRWCDVDLKANELHVTQRADRFNEIGSPKSAKSRRTVPFGPFVSNTLKEWKLHCPKGDLDLVFPNSKGKIDWLPRIIQGTMVPTVVAAGLVDATGKPKYSGLHCFRHFYASWCIDRGLPPKVIQERLGHSSITMTYDRYGHLFPRGNDTAELEQAELAVISATRMQHAG
jgi:integrase